MRSIRRQTAMLVAVSFVALLAAGGAVLYGVLHRTLTAQFDAALAARAEALQSLTRFDGAKVEFDFAGEAMPRFARRGSGEAEYFIAWVRETGGDAWRVLERSESLGTTEWSGAITLSVGPDNLRLPNGSAGRAAVVEFTPAREPDEEGEGSARARSTAPLGAAPTIRILVAASRRPLDHALAAVAWSIAGVGSVLALASVLAARWAVRRGLSPLGDLSARVAAIGPSTLDARLDASEVPAELRPVVEQLVALLARLREAFQRERRFSAAASHELRTPIAELRMLLEVAASRPRTDAEWNATSTRAVAVLDRAESLCESLMRLARAQHGESSPAPVQPVHVAAVLAEAATRALSLHGGDTRRLRVECDVNVTAPIDPGVLGTIVGNLLDNALRHGEASPDRPAACIARIEHGRARVTVTNAAPTVTDDEVARLFEPFWQADTARSRGQGFGLGLAVCRALAEACGGDLGAVRSDDGTLVVTLRCQEVP